MSSTLSLAATPRWAGAPGRMEVWYATVTEPVTGAGLWVHYETIAPCDDRGGQPYGHGWVSVFPVDDPPVTARFGPSPTKPPGADGPWFATDDACAEANHWTGTAGAVSWELNWQDTSEPLWTFPKVAWSRELLPGAQTVVAPSATFTGAIDVAGTVHRFDGGRGAVAHIYSHGSAKRWVWLHADLGNDDVLEIVSAVSQSPVLNRLPAMAFLRLRVDGEDWPSGPWPALRTTTEIALPRWSLAGRIGRRRIRVTVDQPDDRCVALEYVDPDGEKAVCTNTERANVEILIDRRERSGWVTEREWSLRGTGHAEVGLRAPHAPPVNERTRQ